MNIKRKYHYFYKITNLINNHFYYGVHSTNNLDDGYMGSGKRLHIAYKKYGIENFKKEILKYFDSANEAFEYESEVVNEELIKDDNCYNIQQGGKTFNTEGLIPVVDNNGNKFLINRDDPRWINKEVQHVAKGQVTVKDKFGNTFNVNINDPRYLSGELKGRNTGNEGKVILKNNNGKIFVFDKNDPRCLDKNLHGTFYNRKHSKESIEKIKQTKAKNKSQQGVKNSQYGTCWIYNLEKSIKIKKEELNNYIQLGWKKGRKIKY